MFEVLTSQKENHDLTLHFIHYDSEDDNWAEIKLLGLKDYFKEKFPQLKFDSHILTGNDLLSAYDKFIRENGIDVVSLTTHKRNLLKRLFNPSVARKIVFHTNTPMMVFHIR
jgi:nucleotide-binding universal stress UspA family protein